MLRKEVVLSNPERWLNGKNISIPKEKIETAAEKAIDKLENNIK